MGGYICFDFLYVIGEEDYRRYLKKGIFKYCPDKIMKVFGSKIIMDIVDIKENIIGKSFGISPLMPKEKDKFIDEIIHSINNIEERDFKNIVFDSSYIFDNEDILKIERETSFSVADGKMVMAEFLPHVLNEIFQEMKEDLRRKEILIIGEDDPSFYLLVENLSKGIGFLTVTDEKRGYIDELTSNTLEKTGLSIFYSQNVDKILSNYSIIINFKEKNIIDSNKLRKKSVVFDLSRNKIFLTQIKEKTIVPIEDFLFSTKGKIKINEYFAPEEKIFSNKYELLEQHDYKDFLGILANGREYTIEEFVIIHRSNKIKL